MEGLLWLVLIVGVPITYFHPTIRAFRTEHPDTMAIAVANTLLGWLVIPWIALVWWVYRPRKFQPLPTSKICAYCFEQVHPRATKCKHCHSRLTY